MIQMEEFSVEKENSESNGNQLELVDTERTYDRDDSNHNHFEINQVKTTMMNDTVETLDNED